jgi:hypothetical protein
MAVFRQCLLLIHFGRRLCILTQKSTQVHSFNHRRERVKRGHAFTDESRVKDSASENPPSRCAQCPGRTPFRPDPDNLARAKKLRFEPPLDEGIRDIVVMLIANGVETFESCEGGPGHGFPVPTVRFEGATSEGLRALSVALENGLPVYALRRTWGVIDGLIHGPWWEMTFVRHS